MFARQSSVIDCADKFSQFAARIFPPRVKGWSVTAARSCVRLLRNDGLHADSALDSSLRENFGTTERIYDCQPDISTKFAVIATTTGNASPVVLSNYNGYQVEAPPGCKKAQTIYRHARRDNPVDEPLLWERYFALVATNSIDSDTDNARSARATVAAPPLVFAALRRALKSPSGLMAARYFPAASVSGNVEYQDGALANPNPTDIAIQETARMWCSKVANDIIISLGTGHLPRPNTPSTTKPHKSHSAMRIWRWSKARLEDSLDAENIHRQVDGSLDPLRRERYYRLNLLHEDILPRLDDVQCMAALRARVIDTYNGEDFKDIRLSLAAASFYFELDRCPHLDDSRDYICHGRIRIRGPFRSTRALIRSIYHGPVEFLEGETELARLQTLTDGLCGRCRRFNLPVSFSVRNLTEEITISIRLGNAASSRISNFPQCMGWFSESQALIYPLQKPSVERECSTCCRSRPTPSHIPRKRNVSITSAHPNGNKRRM